MHFFGSFAHSHKVVLGAHIPVFAVGKHMLYSCTLQSTCSFCRTLDMWLLQAVILHNEDTHGISKMSNDKTPAKYDLPFSSWSHDREKKKSTVKLGMVAHTCSLALGRLWDGGFRVWCQPGVPSKQEGYLWHLKMAAPKQEGWSSVRAWPWRSWLICGTFNVSSFTWWEKDPKHFSIEFGVYQNYPRFIGPSLPSKKTKA